MTKRLSLALLIVGCAALAAPETARAQDFFQRLFGGGAPGPQRVAPPAAGERKAHKPQPKKKPLAKHAKPSAVPVKPEAPAPAVEGPPPPYEPQLLRLSEILGALAFLRDLCGAQDGDDWRAKMASLLDAEAQSGQRRQKLTGAFNRGFRSYETTYRGCTPNARSAITRYLDEGARIAHDIAYRYGSS
jgi:uncharacterized protein (TIGR02301 family)